jgi:phosphoglycerate dehydrogenase-like enzyme
MKLLHLAARGLHPGHLSPPFLAALRELGELSVLEHTRDWPDERAAAIAREADVLLTSWSARAVPVALAAEPGRLRYVCHLTGTMKGIVPVEWFEAGRLATDWGDAPAQGIAESALTLLLACLKNLRAASEHLAGGGWGEAPCDATQGTVDQLRLGLYGCGGIGRRFVELCRPLRPQLFAFDPFAPELPAGVSRVDSLDALFAGADAVVIHAGLNETTRRSVGAAQLARLRDGGILVNTARGDIVDQEALFAELRSGRLRAGLDVLADRDWLPPEHEARRWSNLLLTRHRLSRAPWSTDPSRLSQAQTYALENLARFARGEPLRFVVDLDRYRLAT